MKQEQPDPIFFDSPDAFREWLAEHHDSREVQWVGFYKKHTGIPSLTWSESVDQAICYGWIDGLRKSIDDERYMIRFSPRKPTSNWSAVNIKKVKKLTELGLMQPAGLAAYQKRKDHRSEVYSYEQEQVKLVKEYEARLKENGKAWSFFKSLPPSARKQSIWWVASAKREATRERRLETLIRSSEVGEKIPPFRIGSKKE